MGDITEATATIYTNIFKRVLELAVKAKSVPDVFDIGVALPLKTSNKNHETRLALNKTLEYVNIYFGEAAEAAMRSCATLLELRECQSLISIHGLRVGSAPPRLEILGGCPGSGTAEQFVSVCGGTDGFFLTLFAMEATIIYTAHLYGLSVRGMELSDITMLTKDQFQLRNIPETVALDKSDEAQTTRPAAFMNSIKVMNTALANSLTSAETVISEADLETLESSLPEVPLINASLVDSTSSRIKSRVFYDWDKLGKRMLVRIRCMTSEVIEKMKELEGTHRHVKELLPLLEKQYNTLKRIYGNGIVVYIQCAVLCMDDDMSSIDTAMIQRCIKESSQLAWDVQWQYFNISQGMTHLEHIVNVFPQLEPHILPLVQFCKQENIRHRVALAMLSAKTFPLFFYDKLEHDPALKARVTLFGDLLQKLTSYDYLKGRVYHSFSRQQLKKGDFVQLTFKIGSTIILPLFDDHFSKLVLCDEDDTLQKFDELYADSDAFDQLIAARPLRDILPGLVQSAIERVMKYNRE